MFNNESLFLKNTLNINNQNTYLLRSLGQTLFIISVPAFFLRLTNKTFYRQVYCIMSSYYIGHCLRKINDDLFSLGKVSALSRNETNK